MEGKAYLGSGSADIAHSVEKVIAPGVETVGQAISAGREQREAEGLHSADSLLFHSAQDPRPWMVPNTFKVLLLSNISLLPACRAL